MTVQPAKAYSDAPSQRHEITISIPTDNTAYRAEPLKFTLAILEKFTSTEPDSGWVFPVRVYLEETHHRGLLQLQV
jgi:hypothetical protein